MNMGDLPEAKLGDCQIAKVHGISLKLCRRKQFARESPSPRQV